MTPIRLPVRVVLVGTSFWLACHAGSPGVAGAEPDTLSLLRPPEILCTGGQAAGALEPEAAAACFLTDRPPMSSLLKQPADADSSGAATPPSTQAPREGPAVAAVSPPSVPTVTSPTEPAVRAYQMDDNHDVRRFLDQFQTGYRRAVVEKWLVRAGRYLPMLLDVFKQKGLPEELVFTAMIESGFDPLAVSRAGAKGLWQFMAPTARRYGLRVDEWLDERLDPEKATVAAARHFIDLYAVFGSWSLAQAAYNAGERTVMEAIRGMGTSDFWALSRGRWLKDETKNFVPAIQAATLIAREPERYGFVVTPAPPLAYELVTVPRSTNLKLIANRSGIDLAALERLNPELRLHQTPPDGAYRLKVPMGGAAQITALLDRDAAERHVAAAPRDSERRVALRAASHTIRPAIHVVKQKETVASIAKRYGVSVASIVSWNDLDDAGRIRPGERLRVASLERREEARGGLK
jgi:transglycosylase-like protein with SLT domain/LysM domain-containing protein